MATIAAATAGDVSDADNGSLHPGRMQNTAGVPAGNGLTEDGLKKPRIMDKTGQVRSGFWPPRVTDKKTRSKQSLYNTATRLGGIMPFISQGGPVKMSIAGNLWQRMSAIGKLEQ